MTKALLKKINISYARFIRKRANERYFLKKGDNISENYLIKIIGYKKNIIKIISLGVFILIFWPILTGNWSGYKINYQNEDDQKNEDSKAIDNTPVMINPRFYGEDSSKNPYIMQAASAVSISEEKIVLYNLTGDIKLKENDINIKSLSGDYYNKTKHLNLSGGVNILSSKGYNLKTNSAHLEMDKNLATGSEEVIIEGVLGRIKANGFTLNAKNNVIEFFGKVELDATTK